jgi:hypothetical protein
MLMFQRAIRGAWRKMASFRKSPHQPLDDRFHEIDHGTSGLFADSSFVIG